MEIAGTFVINTHAKIHMSAFSGSFVTASKLTAK
jgi:hypothetical protein